MKYKHAEECVNCPHQNLCFAYLELAGDITHEGRPIFSGCSDIKANPQEMENQLKKKIKVWRLQIERAKYDKINAEGWKEIR